MREEVGIEEREFGPLLRDTTRFFLGEPGFGGQTNRSYLVRVPWFEARVISEAREARWFTLEEAAQVPTSPHDLVELLKEAGCS